jgi:hypothetical protein
MPKGVANESKSKPRDLPCRRHQVQIAGVLAGRAQLAGSDATAEFRAESAMKSEFARLREQSIKHAVNAELDLAAWLHWVAFVRLPTMLHRIGG